MFNAQIGREECVGQKSIQPILKLKNCALSSKTFVEQFLHQHVHSLPVVVVVVLTVDAALVVHVLPGLGVNVAEG